MLYDTRHFVKTTYKDKFINFKTQTLITGLILFITRQSFQKI
jgi:hypothetical protein